MNVIAFVLQKINCDDFKMTASIKTSYWKKRKDWTL